MRYMSASALWLPNSSQVCFSIFHLLFVYCILSFHIAPSHRKYLAFFEAILDVSFKIYLGNILSTWVVVFLQASMPFSTSQTQYLRTPMCQTLSLWLVWWVNDASLYCSVLSILLLIAKCGFAFTSAYFTCLNSSCYFHSWSNNFIFIFEYQSHHFFVIMSYKKT